MTAADLRACLRCGTDLTDTMGCYIFVAGRNVPGLLCTEHGSNGMNSLSPAEYERLMAVQLPMDDHDPRLMAAIRATRAGEAGMLWQIAGTSGPGSPAARRELLAQAIQAAERVADSSRPAPYWSRLGPDDAPHCRSHIAFRSDCPDCVAERMSQP